MPIKGDDKTEIGEITCVFYFKHKNSEKRVLETTVHCSSESPDVSFENKVCVTVSMRVCIEPWWRGVVLTDDERDRKNVCSRHTRPIWTVERVVVIQTEKVVER